MAKSTLVQFIRLTEFLGKILGPFYEIALHDLSDPDHSLIAISNSQVSGRSLGAPLTEASRKSLTDENFLSKGSRINQSAFTAQGVSLRSSNMLIYHQGQAIGMLCINFDDSKYKAVSESVLRLCHPDSFVDINFQFDEANVVERAMAEDAELFAPFISSGVDEIIRRRLIDMGENPQTLSMERRNQLIYRLDREGYFNVKGSIRLGAEALGVSQATMYRLIHAGRQES